MNGSKKTSKVENTLSTGDKLRKESANRKRMREKLRHGKADNSISPAEARKRQLIRKAARKEIYAEAALFGKLHSKIGEHEQDNVGVEAANRTTEGVETAYRMVETACYSRKLRMERKKNNMTGEGSNPKSKAAQKQAAKKEADANSKKAGKNAKSAGTKAAKEVKQASGKLAEFVSEHPKVVIVILVLALVVILLSVMFSSCGMIAGSMSGSTIATTFTAEDTDILAVEADYRALEEKLQEKIANTERDYPGYDEYRYNLSEIAHNPYELAAILTILYEDYTRDEVQEKLRELHQKQFILTYEEIIETRTRETGEYNDDGTPITQEYDYYILSVTLENKGLSQVVHELGFTADQMERYEILLETKGNKAYLFAGDIYAYTDSEYLHYQIPGEALTDVQFAAMIQEAEKYLGKKFVWGGSSPESGFDCSGFVSWVLNHSGWSVGRQTANGLYRSSTRITAEEAKPGDLIFFQGTYETSGASHVGIYVGNNMMIHCGNPISYAPIDTNYWKQHFYGFGRLPQED